MAAAGPFRGTLAPARQAGRVAPQDNGRLSMGAGNRIAGRVARVRARMSRARHRTAFAASLRHVSGPRPELARRGDAVVVIALVRDGMFHLHDFLQHHRALGAAHFIFCDNGSTDGTLEALRDQPDCLVLQSLMPFARRRCR